MEKNPKFNQSERQILPALQWSGAYLCSQKWKQLRKVNGPSYMNILNLSNYFCIFTCIVARTQCMALLGSILRGKLRAHDPIRKNRVSFEETRATDLIVSHQTTIQDNSCGSIDRHYYCTINISHSIKS